MQNNSEMIRQLKKGQLVISVTVGDSMEPLLYNRDTHVVIAPVSGELRAGEIPLYQRPTGQLVLHRIIRINEAFAFTRGDNRCGLEKVPREWIHGIVVQIERHGKKFDITDPKYRFYVKLWNLIYPIRWVAMKIISLKRRIDYKLSGIIKR